MIQCIYRVAKGFVRISKADGTFEYSDIFDISRGVLQGDIFSPVAFIVGLWRIFKLYDGPNAGVALGSEPCAVHVSDLAYADDAGLVDGDARRSSDRQSSIASGSAGDAAMSVSLDRTEAVYIHRRDAVSVATETEIVEMKFGHRCSGCMRAFPAGAVFGCVGAVGAGERKAVLALDRLLTGRCSERSGKWRKRSAPW